MKTIFAIIGFIVVCLVIGTCAFCGDDDDHNNSLGRPALVAYHGDDQECDRQSDCDSQSYDGQWSNRDRDRNKNRNRGAFSPGPFDRSPVDAFNNMCMPGATCNYGPTTTTTMQGAR